MPPSPYHDGGCGSKHRFFSPMSAGGHPTQLWSLVGAYAQSFPGGQGASEERALWGVDADLEHLAATTVWRVCHSRLSPPPKENISGLENG